MLTKTIIKEYVSRVPSGLKEILQKCSNRFAAIDNMSSSENKKSDVKS